jgi:hypothetical protein
MFLPVKSHFLTTYHDSLLALLFSFFTLAHLSCFLYFSPSHIWSTNYSVLDSLNFANVILYISKRRLCMGFAFNFTIQNQSNGCRSIENRDSFWEFVIILTTFVINADVKIVDIDCVKQRS